MSSPRGKTTTVAICGEVLTSRTGYSRDEKFVDCTYAAKIPSGGLNWNIRSNRDIIILTIISLESEHYYINKEHGPRDVDAVSRPQTR